MTNALQEQLLKAGLVTEKQIAKAKQKQTSKRRKQKGQAKPPPAAKTAAQQAAEKKAQQDRALNRKREEQAQKKALSIEINQLISDNQIKRDQDCDLPYQFEHRGRVKKIYVNALLKQQILDGKVGIARIDGQYELVPKSVAEKIFQRNPQRIVWYQADENSSTAEDEYAEYQVPDDLMW